MLKAVSLSLHLFSFIVLMNHIFLIFSLYTNDIHSPELTFTNIIVNSSLC